MDGYSQHDIREASFEEFVAFLFDHDVVPDPEDINVGPFPWYWHAKVDYDAPRVASFYIRLFNAPGFLLSRFSADQLEQGFWAILSEILDCSVSTIIWDTSVPFEIRERCVRSMFELFAQLFAAEPLDTSSAMWWDSLAFDWDCGNRARANGGEDQLMQDVMFTTLAKLLELPAVTCQSAALHGLGHLHHPGTEQLVQEYLARNKSIDADLRKYALKAATFEVM
jgi:hypothetical protein